MANSFTFDKNSQRFRFTSGERKGQYVSQARVREIVQQRIDRESERIERITTSLLRGDLTLPQWEKSMAERIKTLHIQSYLLGKGGTLNYVHSRDSATLTPIIETQYKYLRRFSEDIRDGKLTPARMKQRAKMYADAGWQTQEHGRAIAHSEAEYGFERNILDRAAENCAECEYFSFIGVVAIGTISRRSPPGTRTCRGQCRCRMEYFKARPEVAQGLSLLMSKPAMKSMTFWVA
jgi:hypothetical protein